MTEDDGLVQVACLLLNTCNACWIFFVNTPVPLATVVESANYLRRVDGAKVDFVFAVSFLFCVSSLASFRHFDIGVGETYQLAFLLLRCYALSLVYKMVMSVSISKHLPNYWGNHFFFGHVYTHTKKGRKDLVVVVVFCSFITYFPGSKRLFF